MDAFDFIIYIFLILLLIFIFTKISNNTDDILSDNLENYDIPNKQSLIKQSPINQSPIKHEKIPVYQNKKCNHQIKCNCYMKQQKIYHDKEYRKYYDKNKKIGKYNGFDNSHQYNENDFKFGSTPIIEILKPDNTNFYFDEGEDLSEILPEPIKTNKTINKDKNRNKTKNCVIDETEADADIFIRKRLLNGENYRSPKNYSNNDLKKYRDTHFAFRNNIWQSSNDVDMVDKINDMYLSGDYDLTRNRKGTKIADLFDELTKNENKLTQPCITNVTTEKGIERILDQKTKKIEGHNGNMLSNDRWIYNQEKTINGGNFYDNIKPNEEDHNQEYQAL